MSWFKRTGERKSVSPSSLSRSETDPNTCLEVFQNHWKQACTVILLQDRKSITASGQATGDGVELVMHNLESMITLLVSEDDDGGMPGPILHYVMESELLETFCNWCSVNCPLHDQLRIRQLRLFELVISQSHQMLLIQKPVIKPLLKLLMEVAESSEINNGELEFKLVLVLHQICICISQQGLILESFFSTDTDHGPARFLIFSLLIPFIHREGPVGQKARDALLLIMTLSSRHPHIGHYIANNSHFCPVLATGLNGLYSSLPRRIPPPSEDWHAITKEDCVKIPDLQMFLNSLQFSNAVVQVAHPSVRDQLIHYIYTGFLLPVLAPALHQDIPGLPIPLLDKDLFRISREEVTTATAYLDLFIRHVTDPHLLKAVLQFILTEKYDDALILDSLISRLSSNSLLSTVTLSLFNTLIDLNCEDIMFQLVFRYLVPCTHVMVSQRRSVRDLDLYGKSAEKFLSLRPSCCTGSLLQSAAPTIPSTPLSSSSPPPPQLPSSPHSSTSGTQAQSSSPSVSISLSPNPTHHHPIASLTALTQASKMETSYFEYLHEAKARLIQVGTACKNWKHLFNGESPPPDSLSATKESSNANEDVKVTTEKGEVEKKEMPGFLEVGSFPGANEFATKNLEKKNDSRVHFKLPVEEKVGEEEGDSGNDSSSTESTSPRSADLQQRKDLQNVLVTLADDPKLFSCLKDLDAFLDYLDDLDNRTKDVLDISTSPGNVNDSLSSLDNLINSLSMIQTGHRCHSASDNGADNSMLDINVSSLSPISSANMTQFSFISQSELPHGGTSVLESTAFVDITLPSQGGGGHHTTQCHEKTEFVDVSMSDVLPKDLEVKVNDASSFVNISLVPTTSDGDGKAAVDSSYAVKTGENQNQPRKPSTSTIMDSSSANTVANSTPLALLDADAVTPRRERTVPKDFKKGFKFNTAASNNLFNSPSTMSPKVLGDTTFRMFMSPMSEELPALTPTSPKRHLKYLNEPPNIGPFLITLFSRLEGMVSNPMTFNLLLTGILTRLATYPQPLLRSFLLNHNLVFQPSVKSLIQVLSLLKQKLESHSVRDKQFDSLVSRAKEELIQSEDILLRNPSDTDVLGNVSPLSGSTLMNQHNQPIKMRAETFSAMPSVTAARDKKKVTLTDLFFRRAGRERGKSTSQARQMQRVEVSGSSGYLYINNPGGGGGQGFGNIDGSSRGGKRGANPSSSSISNRNAVYCALVLDEFLKELAALSQEHSVLCLDEGYLSS